MFSHLWIFASDVFFLCPSIHFQEEYIYSRRVLGRDYFLNNVCTWEGLFVTFITNDNMVFPLGFSAAAAAKSLQSCPTPCDPVDGSPLGFPVPGILQARTLELVAISFSNAWKWKVKVKSLSHVRLERPHGLQPTRLLRPWDFPSKSTGVGCHCLLHPSWLDHHKFFKVSFNLD